MSRDLRFIELRSIWWKLLCMVWHRKKGRETDGYSFVDCVRPGDRHHCQVADARQGSRRVHHHDPAWDRGRSGGWVYRTCNGVLRSWPECWMVDVHSWRNHPAGVVPALDAVTRLNPCVRE